MEPVAVVSVVTPTAVARALLASMLPVVESAVTVVPARESGVVLPMPEAALRSMVAAVTRPAPLTAPAELIWTWPPAAVEVLVRMTLPEAFRVRVVAEIPAPATIIALASVISTIAPVAATESKLALVVSPNVMLPVPAFAVKVASPVVVTLPESVMLPPAPTVRVPVTELAPRSTASTAFVRLTLPPAAFVYRLTAPVYVLPSFSVMSARTVVVKLDVPAMVTVAASLMVPAALTFRLPGAWVVVAGKATVLLPVTVTPATGMPLPIAPLKANVPAPAPPAVEMVKIWFPSMAPRLRIPPPVWMTVVPESAMPVSPSPSAIASSLVDTNPATEIESGVAAVSPPLKANESPASFPMTNVPVFPKLTVLATDPPPFRATLYPLAAAVRVVVAKEPAKAIVPVVSVSMTVVAVKSLEKVVPLELRMFTVGIFPAGAVIEKDPPELTARVPSVEAVKSAVCAAVPFSVVVPVDVTSPAPRVTFPPTLKLLPTIASVPVVRAR